MIRRTGLLMLAVVAAGLTLVSADNAQAFFGRRGGSEGSSGGCGGSSGGCGGSSGGFGSSGSFGGHGGLFRHRRGGSFGSSGGSGGSCGESSSCGDCDAGSDTSSCGCGDSASSSEGSEHAPQQAAVREERGERHEAGYNSETRIRANQPMPAPEYSERRSDNDRQARDRGNESRETGPSLNSDSKRDSEKSDSSADSNSDQKKQE